METISLTKPQARRFILSHQGLRPPHALAGKAGALEHIRRVGCIQFDPLNIAGRNPELVLQARVADFQPAMLEELLYRDRHLLDGWDKMMSIYPVEDWPFFQRRRAAALERYNHGKRPAAAILPEVRAAIKRRGPLSSIDLDFDQTVDWAWAPTRIARAALESMYYWGELVIHHKVNTRKVYDFAARHIPTELLHAADPNPTEAQFHDWYLLRRVGGIGMVWDKAGDAWLGIPGLKSAQRKAAMARLLERGELLEVSVDGISVPLVMRAADLPTLETSMKPDPAAPRAAILAPLDNLLWDRRFVEALFDFRYRWEVYKPAAEREFGYYVLPVLYGERFIARFEPGRDKKANALIIQNWWWEPGVEPDAEIQAALRACFERFMGFLGVKAIRSEAKADLPYLPEGH